MTHRLVEDNDDEAEQVVPTLKAWQDRKLSSRWSNTAASQPAFDRADFGNMPLASGFGVFSN